MLRNPKTVLGAGALVVLAAVAAGPAAASHSVVVTAPNLPQEALTWCGPAVAEMLMEGYPAGSCDHVQADIWAEIGFHKVEAMWDTDPEGLRSSLVSLCPPPGGGWSITHRTDAEDLMFRVAYWMTRRGYPVGLVLDTDPYAAYPAHTEHWVVLEGIVTDVDPTQPGVTSATLEWVLVTDPHGAVLGDPVLTEWVSGADWTWDAVTNPGGSFKPVSKAGSAYDGEYVAVIEPPRVRGRLVVERLPVEGTILPVEEILRRAQRQLEEMTFLRETKPFARLERLRPLEPLLVNPKRGGYYLIPYSADGKTAEIAVLVNAYEGRLLRLGTLPRTRYISQRDAVERASKFVGIDRPQRSEARLMFEPRAGAGDRYHPVWQVRIDQRVVAVSQTGRVRALKPLRREPD